MHQVHVTGCMVGLWGIISNMCIDDTLQDPSVVSRSMFVSGSSQERLYIPDICHNHTSSGGSLFSSWCTI